MTLFDRPVLAGGALVTAACVLAACGNSPGPRAASGTTTSSTTTTTVPAPTTVPAGVRVPNVVGMKFHLARYYLGTAGFETVALDAPCNEGTLARQSVAVSLSVPGRPPNVTVGAQPLLPGTLLAKGARVGIRWSGCYPEGTQVPWVTAQTFAGAVHLLHAVGLRWACYSVGPATTTTTDPTTTTTTHPATTISAAPASTSTPRSTTTAPKTPQTILSQGTKAGTVVHADSVVDLFMHHCPQ